MTKWEIVIPNLLGLILLIVLLILFLYHSQKQNRPVQNLLTSVIWGIIYAVIVIINGFEVIESDIIQDVLQALYLTCLSIQCVFFYLFIENSKVLKPRIFNFSLIMVILSIQCHVMEP